LKLFETKVQGSATNAFWRIEMKDALKPGETAVVSYFILHWPKIRTVVGLLIRL
jgi:hypothetical protein